MCLTLYQVLDRIKVLHGPRTQTYGETSYFQKRKKKNEVLDRTKVCMVLGLKPMGKLATSKKKKRKKS